MQRVKLNDKVEIHIQKVQFESGEVRLDLRAFVSTKKYTGYSPKGINIPLSKVPELADAILREYDSLEIKIVKNQKRFKHD